MCDLVCSHWCMHVEVFLDVATLDISMPLAVVLDGGATIFPTSTAVDFLPEIRHHVASHHACGAASVGAHLAALGAPAPRMARTPLTESTTAAQMVGTTSHGVAC
jgi:hypothetical protein